MIKVAVGSTNPVKTKAVKRVFEKLIGEVSIIGIKVDSKVSRQPMSFDEAYKGALNRAWRALKKARNTDFGVGIEGGVNKFSFGWFTAGIVVIVNKKGKIGCGISASLPLSKAIIRQIRVGRELGDVIEEISGIKNIKQKQGAFGLFTKGFITRQSGYEQAVAFALSRFLESKKFFNRPVGKMRGEYS